MKAADSPQSAAGVEEQEAPYALALGHSVHLVKREAMQERLRIEFLRWSDLRDGVIYAHFRVTNPGARPILVWNVRQEVRRPSSNGVVSAWEMRQEGYPGFGWEGGAVPPGGTTEFPYASNPEFEWRLCLLYSREKLPSLATNRQFGGTFEAIGPSVREPEWPPIH